MNKYEFDLNNNNTIYIQKYTQLYGRGVYAYSIMSVIECSRVNISVKTIISIIIVAHMCVYVLLVYITMLCGITGAVFLDLFANLLFVFFAIFYRYKDNSDVFTNVNSIYSIYSVYSVYSGVANLSMFRGNQI